MRPWEEICAVEVEKIEQEEHQRDGVAAVRRQLDHAVGGDAVGAHGLGWHFDLALELARATSRLLKKSVGDASSPIRHLLPLRNPLI